MCYKIFFAKPLQQVPVHCQYDEKTLRYQSQDIPFRCFGFKILKTSLTLIFIFHCHISIIN